MILNKVFSVYDLNAEQSVQYLAVSRLTTRQYAIIAVSGSFLK